MDRQHLEGQLAQDYKLLKKLEDKFRVEDDPKRQEKLRLDIEDLKNKIYDRQRQLQQTTNNQNIESQPSENNQDFSSSVIHADQTSTGTLYSGETERELLSLTDLASFCSYAFPLLRWIHQPVPAKYVNWYFDKIQEFFMFEGEHIPQGKWRFLFLEVECFFRCAYMLPSESFKNDLGKIHNYSREKLGTAYVGFLKVFREFGYEISPYLEPENGSLSRVSLMSIFSTLRKGFSHILTNTDENNIQSLTLAERDILIFMIYVIDFLFKEHSARSIGKHLDLPEGVALKLHDILNHAFQNHLGVRLPKREDTDTLADFPSYVHQLMQCWKEPNGKDIGDL